MNLLASIVIAVIGISAAFGQTEGKTSRPINGSPSLPEVTVTSPRPPTPQELADEAVPNFITAHTTPSTIIHQLTRWRNGICPLTQGLSPAFNAFVSARIEAVAAAVGRSGSRVLHRGDGRISSANKRCGLVCA
jgi:hypothetical protein